MKESARIEVGHGRPKGKVTIHIVSNVRPKLAAYVPLVAALSRSD